jgi:hypothetical protein
MPCQRMVVAVSAGEHLREHCLVSCLVPWSPQCRVAVQRKGTRKVLPSQSESTREGTRVWWLVRRLPPHAQLVYELSCGVRQRRSRSQVRVVRQGPDRVTVQGRSRSYAALHLSRRWPTPFWNPLRTPTGHSVTAALVPPGEPTPPSMPPHAGLWVGYPAVGTHDCWNPTPPRLFAVLSRPVQWESGALFGTLSLEVDWLSAEQVPLLRVEQSYRFYAPSARGFVMDLEVRLLARYGPVVLWRSRWGGLVSLALAHSLAPSSGARVENALGGSGAAECHGYASPWINVTHLAGGRWLGVAVMLPTGQFEWEPWYLHPDGILSVGGYGDPRRTQRWGDTWVQLATGEEHCFSCRIYCHSGNPQTWDPSARYAEYIFGPSAELLEIT